MKKAVLIWEMPLILGTPSNPISHILYHKTAERYVERFTRFCKENSLDWCIILDETHGDVEELLQNEIDMLVFAPGRRSRSFVYNKELKETSVPIYMLTEEEYQNGKFEKWLNI